MRTRRIPEGMFLTYTPNRQPWRIRWSVLLLILSVGVIPLTGATLLYDQTGSGKLKGFTILSAHNPAVPSGYENSTEYYSSRPFIGRLVYEGPPSTFTFTNNGPEAAGGDLTKFHWTRINDTSEWREIFFLIRVKGMTHGGTTDDFVGINKGIATTGCTYLLPHGAGSETVEAGKEGFDAQGNAGTNTNGSHPYKYKFRYIWFDTMVINASDRSWGAILDLLPSTGYYETQLLITTTSGAIFELTLSAHYLETIFHAQPFPQAFVIEKEFLEPIPYADLEWRKDISSSLKIATIRYISDVHKAKITFSSSSDGSNQTFSFLNAKGRVISYLLAFEPTISTDGAFAKISTTNKTYYTKQTTVPSPIGGAAYQAHRLEGDLRIYLPLLGEANPPMPGVYRSNIYVLVEKD